MSGLASDEGPVPPDLTRGELQQRAVKGIAWTALSTFLLLPLAFVVNLVIARTLGAVSYGRLAFLSALLETLTGILLVGIGTGLVQFGAKANVAGRRNEVKALLSAAQGFRLLVVAPVLAVVVLLVADVSPALLALTLVFGVLLPSALSGAPACFGIENRTADGAKNAIIVAIVTQGAVLATVLTAREADAVWATRLVCSGLGVALALAWISRDYRGAVLRPSWPWRLPRAFWRFALPAGAAEVVATLVTSRSEIFILKWLGEPSSVGLFAVAFGLAAHLFAPAATFFGPLIPALSGLREVDPGSLRDAFLRVLRATTTAVALIVASAVPALSHLMGTLYGAQYGSAAPVVLVLGMSQAMGVAVAPISAFVVSRLAGRRMLWYSLVALVVDVALAVALIPPLGIWGAVIANVASALIFFGQQLVSERRSLGLPWKSVGHASLPLLLGWGCGLLGWVLGRATLGDGVASGAVSSFVGMAALAVCLRLTRSGMTHADLDVLTGVLPSPVRPVARALGLLVVRSDQAAAGAPDDVV